MTREELNIHINSYLKQGKTIQVLPQFIDRVIQKHTIYSHNKRSRGSGMTYTKPRGFKTSSVYNGFDIYKTPEVIKHISTLKIREAA